jgi:multiple antibiotic resistance protein
VVPQNPLQQAFYPLTLPLTIGPGTISVAITLGANLGWGGFNNALVIAATVLTAAIVAGLVFLCNRFAEPLAKRMGETAMSVLLRLSSFILLCIGVQIVWNGLTALIRNLPR